MWCNLDLNQIYNGRYVFFPLNECVLAHLFSVLSLKFKLSSLPILFFWGNYQFSFIKMTKKNAEMQPNFYAQLTQYTQDLELMLESARAYVISKISGSSPPSDNHIQERA